MIPQKEIKAFQKEILDWYEKSKRDLPWRETRDPYKILVSEIMSHQTQISRVIPKYEAWLVAFPTVEALAKAKPSEVLKYWSGLGYNRRALYLQKCAKVLCHPELVSGSPWDSIATLQSDTKAMIAALKKLPGIGEYTAAAVACFAFGAQIPVVDTNVKKVILTRFHKCHCEENTTKQSPVHKKDCHALPAGRQGSLAMTSKELQEIADRLLPIGRAAEWNQALMDYAALMLKKEKIPVPKQSKFLTSDRYFRGQLIKLLIQIHTLTIEASMQHFVNKKTPIDKSRLDKIIEGLIKDTLIQKKGDILSLKE